MCGLVFAYITIVSGSLWPAIIVHALNNSLSCIDSVIRLYFDGDVADIFYYAMGSAELLAENIGQIFCIWVSTLVGNFIGCNASNKRPYLAQN
jgi:membrane protease YdiL (CAAX protease family)